MACHKHHCVRMESHASHRYRRAFQSMGAAHMHIGLAAGSFGMCTGTSELLQTTPQHCVSNMRVYRMCAPSWTPRTWDRLPSATQG